MFLIWNKSGASAPLPRHRQDIPEVRRVNAPEPSHRKTEHSTRMHRGAREYQRAVERTEERRPALVAADIMTAPVVTLGPQASLREAHSLFVERRFRHVPVVRDGGHLAGILSDRDLLQHAGRARPNELLRVESIMKTQVVSATLDTEIREIAGVLFELQIGAAPITDAARALIGILTRSDILRAVAHRAPLELWT